MKKPLVGIVPLVDEDRESLWMLPGYMEGLTQAGAIPVMLPLTADREDLARLVEELDGVLLSGGHDVDPAVYGEKTLPQCGVPCTPRDEMEKILLELALEGDKPVLGICRGLQFLNAALGGTLYQDIPTQRPSQLEHHQTPPYDRPVHQVRLKQDGPLAELLDTEALEVNSYHHQGIKTLASGLEEMARAEDGLIEAVWMPGKRFVWGVQWHPEFSWKTQEASRRILKAFVRAAEKA